MAVVLYVVGLALAALAVRIYFLGSKKALINWIANSSIFYYMYKRQLAAHHASPDFNVTSFETTILDGAATVVTIPFLQDNFAYILFDHATGGNRKLKAALTSATIVGGVLDSVQGSTKQTWHGDKLKVGSLTVETLAVPCHTMGHVAYYGTVLLYFLPFHISCDTVLSCVLLVVSATNHTGHGCVFTGDTLFVAGTGRFFEGNGDQMHRNLSQVLGALPPTTRVFCGHEYTLQNLSFALFVEPDNVAVQTKVLLLRVHAPRGSRPADVMTHLRQMKDDNVHHVNAAHFRSMHSA
ncbi:hypothetical protein B5M09_013025 [Aphanomyces astaci]|uniref:Metallo-beta-lactamase domain-containing protein n=1 Tax=Aphanomyces astaci TaxID=112090 RepID=A0A425DMS2_APHAT|nr:hypothetical protein B5M09_013025 [Aphanomyces astaci]